MPPKLETFGDLDLKEMTPCALCGEALLPGNPHFYRITLQSFIFDARTLQQLMGTAQVLGGNLALGAVMAPSTTVAQAPVPASTFIVHQDCALNDRLGITSLMLVAEEHSEKESADEPSDQ